jgi:glycosyltransferase involved in cell wall biosynthesis
MPSPKILYIINTSRLFVSHRMHLAKAIKDKSYEVHVLAPMDKYSEKISENGFHYHYLGMDRKSMNPFIELCTLWRIFKTILTVNPSIVHSFTIKPVVYAGLSSLIFRKKKFVSTITGLGYLFIREDFFAKVIQFAIGILYRISFSKKDSLVVFQNFDDQKLFTNKKWVRQEKTRVILGTGVDTLKYSNVGQGQRAAKKRIIFPARFLKDKGIFELIEAGKILYSKNLSFEILLCGDLDPDNKACITQAELESICKLPFIVNRGYCKDMASEYKNCEIVCLPSYREGIPLALIEACASGKPIVTTDVPGCREVVRDGTNGFVVPVKSTVELAEALKKLIESSDLVNQFSKNSREFALKNFEKNLVVQQNMNLYN